MRIPKLLLLTLLTLLTTSLTGSLQAAPAREQPLELTSALQWRLIGPFRGGRTRAVAGVPTQPNVFYIGATDGGVWKTEDAGRTWQPIFDDQPTQSIGAIAVAASEPSVLYVGSGEGLHRPDLSVGNGMYRSADGGRSWTHLGLADAQQIPDIAIDPRDPNRVFAAVLGHPFGPSAQRGIYRSVDGGRNWEQVLHKDDSTGGSAVAIDPSRPQIVFAALWQSRLGPWEDRNEFQGSGGGLFKSTDGGTSWKQLTNGLPANLTQVNISIAASKPDLLYAAVATNEPGAYSSSAGLGLYRSENGGESWVRATPDPRTSLRIGGGDLPIVRIDPSNPDVLYCTGIVTVRSLDGGRTWESLRGAPGGDDYQNLWINPLHPDTIALVSDQGAVISVNRGKTWSSWFNQPTAQLYHVSVTPTFPYRVCAGQQESGSVCIASRGNDGEITDRDWHPVGVIEYGYVAPDPLDPDVIYGAGRALVSKYHWSTGEVQDVTPIPVRGADDRVDRTEPIMFAPLDPHTLYYAANKLYRSKDGGANWEAASPDLTREDPGVPASVGALHLPGAEHQRGVIYSLGLSARSADVLWAGTDDGLIWHSTDGGQHWANVTPPALTPWSKVTQIDASHFDSNTAYISVSRLRVDDLHPYVYRTRDGGSTWESIAAGLPDAPVNAVREDPQRAGLLYLATETAVWLSPDDGGHWQSLQMNLPHTSMRDLWVHENDLILGTHGRSIWILDDITPLRQIPQGTPREPLLLQPAPAYRLPRSTWTDTPIPPDEPLAANPPAGAVIDYVLPHAPKRLVLLEIIDSKGSIVRRFASNDPLKPTAEERARELIPQYWLIPPHALPAERGAHRWVWDLHYKPPLATVHGYPISAVPHRTPPEPEGPLAVPGSYRVRLSVDGQHLEQTLTLKPDPRSAATQQALQQQFDLTSHLAELMTRTSTVLLAAQSEQKQLQDLKAADATAEMVSHFTQRLGALLGVKAAGGAPSPTQGSNLSEAQGQLTTLYQAIVPIDAAPTAAQTRAAATLEARIATAMTNWQELQGELPELNKRLRSAQLSAVRADLPPPRDLNVADEE